MNLKNTIFLLIVLAGGCGLNGPVNETELKAYIADPRNGLLQENQSGSLKLQAQYRPVDLLIAQALRTVQNDQDSKIRVRELRKQYGQYHYFALNFSNNDRDALHSAAGNDIYFDQLLQTLSFHMGEYVTLTTSESDTISVADFIFPRMFGSSRSTSLLFAFSREKIGEYDWLQLNMKEFGLGTGGSHFRFRKRDLQKMPEVDHLIL